VEVSFRPRSAEAQLNIKMSGRGPTPSCSALYLHGNSRHNPGSWFRRSLWSHPRRPWLGLAACRLVRLFQGSNKATSKNRDEHGVLALGGRHLAATHNNQPIVGGSGGKELGDETCGG